MTDKIEKSENDYDKGTLVYATSLMLDCKDKVSDFNKLTKATLWRLYDGMKDRGNAFANMEDLVRTLQRENNELHAENKSLNKKVKLLEKKLRGNYKRHPKARK